MALSINKWPISRFKKLDIGRKMAVYEMLKDGYTSLGSFPTTKASVCINYKFKH